MKFDSSENKGYNKAETKKTNAFFHLETKLFCAVATTFAQIFCFLGPNIGDVMSTIGPPKILKNICELFGASITMENEHWHLMNSMTP